MRSTPTHALLTEAAEPPLHLRFKFLTWKYVTNVMGTNSNVYYILADVVDELSEGIYGEIPSHLFCYNNLLNIPASQINGVFKDLMNTNWSNCIEIYTDASKINNGTGHKNMGNETADLLAKQAVAAGLTEISYRILPADLLPPLRRNLFQSSQNEWDLFCRDKAKTYYKICPTVSNRQWFYNMLLPRAHITTLCRIRFNHTLAPAHL